MGIYQIRSLLTFTLLYLANLSLVHSGPNHTGLLISLSMPYTNLPWGLFHVCSLWLHPLLPGIYVWLTPSFPSMISFKINTSLSPFLNSKLPHLSISGISFDLYPIFFCCCCSTSYHLLYSIKYILLVYFV